MLHLQAQTLEQQERLYKNQIRLNIREILKEELNFYTAALTNMTATSAILAGFALAAYVRFQTRLIPLHPVAR